MQLFPLKSEEELQQFNDYLQEEHNATIMSNWFSTHGGKDCDDCVWRIMTWLITNDLAKKLNWKGRGIKASFSKFTHFRQLICGAISLNPDHKSAKDSSIESVIKHWLQNSIDRDVGRTKHLKVCANFNE